MKLQASEEISFEAETIDQLREMVAIWRKDCAPLLLPPAIEEAPILPPAAHDEDDEHDEQALSERYQEKHGKRFFFRAAKHPGQTRLEVLRAVLCPR